MTEPIQSPISIPDQILEALFSSLEVCGEFDAELVEKLKDLANRKELTKANKVASVLKTIREGQDEAHRTRN